MFGRHMTLLALKTPGVQNYFSLVRPNTGESYFDVEVCFAIPESESRLLGSALNVAPDLDCHSHHQC